jgi:hypothetical protein
MTAKRGPVPVLGTAPAADARDLPQEILDQLDKNDTFHTSDAFPGITQPVIKAALDRLASRFMVDYTAVESEAVYLTPDGEALVATGCSPEVAVWRAVKDAGTLPLKDLRVCLAS